MAKLISAREARARLGGISTMTEWRWRKAGILPAPVSIRSRNYYMEDAIDAVIASAGEHPDKKAAA